MNQFEELMNEIVVCWASRGEQAAPINFLFFQSIINSQSEIDWIDEKREKLNWRMEEAGRQANSINNQSNSLN